MPLLDQPARDGYVEVTDEGDPYLTDELYVNGDENHVPTDPEEQKHFFHGLMDAELCAAELMARNSHEHPEMPWDFHVDMARQCWDEIRHAEVHDALMATELDCHWGDYPIGFGYFKSVYAYDLLGRLVLFNGTSEQKAMWRHSHRRKVLIELGQDDGRARVRLPAGRRGAARAQRQALGHVPARRRRGRLPREAARAARRARRHGAAGRELTRADAAPSPPDGAAPRTPLRQSTLLRPRRPALPDFEMALLDVLNGLREPLAELAGRLARAAAPVPITFWPPRSGCRERRGNRNARMRSRMQKPMTAPMIMPRRIPDGRRISQPASASASASAGGATRTPASIGGDRIQVPHLEPGATRRSARRRRSPTSLRPRSK